jgi:DNA polymerase III gamma/tau subunit
MSLYHKYRPTTFDKVLGCETTVAKLKNMVQRGTVPNVILFLGPSGTGKTTLARILKAELKCSDLDFVELNSASYRGIDSIREIQRLMHLAPADGPVRVWLLDEVASLSKDAMNASLKMLEDQPKHVYFFLCTTDPGKLLPAIRTRCCEMPVQALTDDAQTLLVQRVAKKESLEITEQVVSSIVTAAQGSARTALVLLDSIANLDPEQQAKAVEAKLEQEFESIHLCRALIKGSPWIKVSKILKGVKGEPEELRRGIIGYARTVLLNEGSFQAYNVIKAFESPFYDSGTAGLAAACYDAIATKQS